MSTSTPTNPTPTPTNTGHTAPGWLPAPTQPTTAPVDDTPETQRALSLERPVQSVAQLYQKTTEVLAQLDDNKIWPQGRAPGLYARTLVGLPFLSVSDWIYRMLPARQGKNSMGEPVTYPARECVQVYVQLVDTSNNDPRKWAIPWPAELATLTGSYLVNQFRSLIKGDVIGAGVFTIAPNPKFNIPSGHPLMLKFWEHGRDDQLAQESTF